MNFTLSKLRRLLPQTVERCGSFYIPGYGDPDITQLESITYELLSLEWLTKRTARHEYFMSLVPREYSYGNRGLGSESYVSRPFSPLVEALMGNLNGDLGTGFNVCFLNKYDDQHQHLGWHADDFPGMREEEPIAVVSFGVEREIWVKPKGEKGEVPDNQRIKLEEGSVFLMPPGYQATHLHRIPKHNRPCGWRVSLTFRSFH